MKKDAQITLDIIKDCPLERSTPFCIKGVSGSQFSIARHYGGIKFQQSDYTYLPHSDELIRDDVLKWARKNVKPATKSTP